MQSEDQELLAELMEASFNDADVFLRGAGESLDMQEFQGYPQVTPAHRHEQLAYENNGVSYLDDMFTGLDQEHVIGHEHGRQESISNQNNAGHMRENGVSNGVGGGNSDVNMNRDTNVPGVNDAGLLFQQYQSQMSGATNESLASLPDSFYGSSLDSNVSEVSSMHSFTSSGQLMPQPIDENSILVNRMSPSSFRDTIRPGNFLSTSLRTPSSMTRQARQPSFTDGSVSQSHMNMLVGSVPKNVTSMLTPDEKLKRKREFHNAVERRRRELIKQKIKELSKLVPPSLLNYDSEGNQIKSNRGTILDKSVEYLEYLLYVIEVQKRKREALQDKIEQLTILRNKMNNEPNNLPRVSSQTTLKANDFKHDQYDSQNFNPHENTQMNDVDMTHNNPENSQHDDLQEFLSGDIVEAEDNAKLMFKGYNPAEYLLDFE
ncbi:Retrograde regulation protein 3 [Nakaseomyces bracarensis]|uniref:Retrograde regulation protein 3 n=1 Tax=Nakaseomyces bracarensis TaxID=273131 RepID=A0ABR4NYX2_9SACH